MKVHSLVDLQAIHQALKQMPLDFKILPYLCFLLHYCNYSVQTAEFINIHLIKYKINLIIRQGKV